MYLNSAGSKFEKDGSERAVKVRLVSGLHVHQKIGERSIGASEHRSIGAEISSSDNPLQTLLQLHPTIVLYSRISAVQLQHLLSTTYYQLVPTT